MKIIILQFFFLFLSFFSYATTYYVAITGNDINIGSQSNPWRTIQKAANTLIAGDSVFIRQGVYNERLIPLNSGNANQYITYIAFPGDTVVLDGASITLPDELAGMVDIRNKSYIKVIGFKIQNARPYDNNAGIFIDTSQYISIVNNHTYNTVSSGIGIWNSNNILVDSNEVELANNDGEQENISIVNTDSFVISNNLVHNGGPGTNGGEGIDAKWGSSNGKIFGNSVYDLPNDLGIYLDAWDRYTFNIEIYQNIVHDCAEGIDIASEAGGLLENISIYNNIIYNNTYNGSTIGNWGDVGVTQRPINNVKIINNTFYNNGTSGNWGGAILVENPDATNILIRNNICSQNFSYQILINDTVSSFNYIADHNLIDGFRNEYGEIYGSDSVVGNPMFVNASNADFYLLSGSPAIDNGSNSNAPLVDFNYVNRPIGTICDIGAYEFDFNTSLFDMEVYSFMQNYPNPFNSFTTIKFFTTIKNGELNIFNVYGKNVKVIKSISGLIITLFRDNLPSGLYLLRLTQDSKIIAIDKLVITDN